MITVQCYDSAHEMIPVDLREIGIYPPVWQRWLRRVAADYGYSIGALNYVLCTDEQELAINRQFLSHDYYTDVITFDYTAGNVLSGDVFMSVDTIRENAATAGVSYRYELLRIFAHALLHLTGQGDKTPASKAEMTKKEDAALSKIDSSIFVD